MSLSNCSHCWETPCCCGYEYKDYSREKFSEFIADILSYKSKKDAIYILKRSIQLSNKLKRNLTSE